MMQESSTKWQSNMTAHMEKTIAARDYTKSMNIKTITRKRLRLIRQAITGHCALNYHLHKIKRAETPTCEKCNDEDETMEHFLGKCPTFLELRMEHLDQGPPTYGLWAKCGPFQKK